MRKLSFVLAMILALSGLVGLFAAPAYAADEAAYNYEYVVGEGGYATIADALAAVKKNEETKPASTHGIKVTADVTELKYGVELPAGADVTIYAVGETKPVITISVDATGSGNGWLMGLEGAALTLDNLSIQNPRTTDVVFVAKNIKCFDLTVNNCVSDTVGRFARVDAGNTLEGSVCNYTFKDTVINGTSNSLIQFNNRGIKDDKPENVILNLVIDNCDITINRVPNADPELAGNISNDQNKNKNILHLNARTLNLEIVDSNLVNYCNGGKTIHCDQNNVAAEVTMNVVDSYLYATGNVVSQAHGTSTLNFVRTEIVAEAATSSTYASAIYADPNGSAATPSKAVDVTINVYDCLISQIGGKTTAAIQLTDATKGTLNVYGKDTVIYSEKYQPIFTNGAYDVYCYDGTYVGGKAAVQTYKNSTGSAYIYGGTYVCETAPIVNGEDNVSVLGGKFYTNAATYCEDNEADSVATALENKTFDGVTYTTAVEVTPKLDGVEFNSDFFKVKGAQLYGGTTADSASTVVRVLFMVKADEIGDYDNIAAWYSTTDSVCVNLNGEVPSAIANEYAHAGEYVNETEKTNKVYESVLAGGEKVEADDGYYFIPVSINVSNANFGTNIYLRLFARLDGGEGLALSDVVTINIEDMFFN